MAEKPGALYSGFPIQHFDIQNGATKPMEFNRVQTAYLSNANSTNKFELRYYPIDDIVEFEDGWLVSGAKGEWGGILYWMGLDGDIDILIKNSDNPSDVALLNDAVYITWSPFLPVTNGHSDLIRIRNPKAGEIEVESFAVPGGVTGFKYEAGDLWLRRAHGISKAFKPSLMKLTIL